MRNLTRGFDKDLGFDHIVQLGVDSAANPWMAWSPKGDRLAYFVRTEKERALVVQNVLTRKIEERIPAKSVDEPESPAFSPDGRTVAFSALRNAIGAFPINLDTKVAANITEDRSPTRPDLLARGHVHDLRRGGSGTKSCSDRPGDEEETRSLGTRTRRGAVHRPTPLFARPPPTRPCARAEVSQEGNIYTSGPSTSPPANCGSKPRGLRQRAPIVLNGQDQPHRGISYFKKRVQHQHLERRNAATALVGFRVRRAIIAFRDAAAHVARRTRKRKAPREISSRGGRR